MRTELCTVFAVVNYQLVIVWPLTQILTILAHMVLINIACRAKFNALVGSNLFLENRSTYFEPISHLLPFFYNL